MIEDDNKIDQTSSQASVITVIADAAGAESSSALNSGNSNFTTTDSPPTIKLTNEKIKILEKDVSSTREEFKVLEGKVSELEAKLTKAKDNFEKSRYDLITLLGVFVGLITYLGLEIQVFKIIKAPLLIVGISIFFIASLLLFILTMNVILKKQDSTWSDFKSPLYFILIILLVISIIAIVSGVYYNNLIVLALI